MTPEDYIEALESDFGSVCATLIQFKHLAFEKILELDLDKSETRDFIGFLRVLRWSGLDDIEGSFKSISVVESDGMECVSVSGPGSRSGGSMISIRKSTAE